MTLENTSKHTIHISERRCEEPAVVFETKESSGWSPISGPKQSTCDPRDWIDLRLKPGQKTKYETRLVSPRRGVGYFYQAEPGSKTLRASWTLLGCTETTDGKDCLAPLQNVTPLGGPPNVDFQEPVTVLSNEVTVESPQLPDPGVLKFEFEVSLSADRANDRTHCAEEAHMTPDCAVFHYYIRNRGSQAVRNATLTCSNSGITPEYRLNGGEWRAIPQISWICSSNITIETPILSGQAIEGTFTLATLAPGYDTSGLGEPGEYAFRFTFWPAVCVASTDGSFCVVRPEKQPPFVSNVVIVNVPELNAPN
ncbi:MAG TPA: hypothetical protein VIY69_00865 [Candidatus Acidoferrales bacterium]